MAIWNFVKDLGTAAVEAYKVRVEAKNRLKLAELESHIKAEQAWAEWRVQNINADAAWEQASIQNSGWKDEFVLLVLSIPLVAVFVPYTAPFVLQGFQILETTPEWYRWLAVMIYAATFGIRIWRRQM
jgi:hypothetical protein